MLMNTEGECFGSGLAYAGVDCQRCSKMHKMIVMMESVDGCLEPGLACANIGRQRCSPMMFI